MDIQLTYNRRQTTTTKVGNIEIGSEYPVRIQTMANTSTNDIEGSVAQAERCIEAGAELLRKDGIKCRIVSVPSEGLFRSQCTCYQEEVLPAGVKKFGLTAGLPVNLQGLVPVHEGKVWGLESFGFSAPYKVLDEKLGFTAENVYNQVKAML